MGQWCRWGLALSVAVGLAWGAPAAASAQDPEPTRAEMIAEAQAEKAKHLSKYQPNTLERIARDLRGRFLGMPAKGVHPWFESVYSGGGFTLGGGYRRFYGDRTFWDARGAYSLKSYKRVELATTATGLGHGRVDLNAVGGWRDATQVNFYGVGGDTAPEGQSNFRMQTAYAGGQVRSRGPRSTLFDLGLFYEDYTLESGTGSTPSIEDRYTPDTAPGLGANPAFLHLTWTGGIDTRPSPGYARHGGLYALTYDIFADTGETYSFERLDAEVVHHIPVLRENWVLSLRGAARTTIDDDDAVPYFLLPSLGSGSTLRAYSSWRFRDRHSLLLSAEWRWIPSRLFMDMAFFYDAGKVASRRADLNFTDLVSDVGVGVRFHGPLTTPLRVDVAHGREGLNIVFSAAAAF